ncbi:hypothetical protein Dip518_000227 [Parelusimicrobium proximum]|uniref:hypothetical protein n=1 Tax=Parelusimicrobium proximum TaxID=3228953 RepID=UPI003D175F33
MSNLKQVNKAIESAQITDKKSVEKKFGEPTNIFNRDGKVVYEYKYSKAKNPVLSFFPILCFVIPDKVYYLNYLYITFDDNWRVEEAYTRSAKGKFPPPLYTAPQNK